MEQVETAPYSETRRMQLRGLILLSSEIISQYWPMRTFVHHNPLHGLEDLHFEDAVRRGHQLLGGKGYLSNELFRGYVRSGRIRPHHIDAALKTLVHDKHVALGAREISHFEVLRAHLLQGITAPAEETLDAQINRRPDRTLIKTLADHLTPALNPPAIQESLEAGVHEERTALGRRSTLAAWCDYTLGSQIMDQINGESIKWCEAFLDEGHATWPMPGRENGFYGAWKFLAEQEWSPCGIADSRQKIAGLPTSPEDALLEHLAALGIPSEGTLRRSASLLRSGRTISHCIWRPCPAGRASSNGGPIRATMNGSRSIPSIWCSTLRCAFGMNASWSRRSAGKHSGSMEISARFRPTCRGAGARRGDPARTARVRERLIRRCRMRGRREPL